MLVSSECIDSYTTSMDLLISTNRTTCIQNTEVKPQKQTPFQVNVEYSTIIYITTHMCIVYPQTNSENLYNLRVHTVHVRCTYRWQACRANRTNKEHDYSNWSQLFRLPQFPWISTLVKRKCGNRVRKTVRSSSAIAPKKKTISASTVESIFMTSRSE